MGEHYYTNHPTSASDRVSFDVDVLGRAFHFATDSGVFSKGKLDRGTETLLKALGKESFPIGGEILDMCCGWGAIGIIIAAQNPHCRVWMRDVNARAVELARENIEKNRAKNAVAEAADGFTDIGREFSAILMNPPVRAGKELMYGLYRDSFAHLIPGGRLYIVLRKAQGAPSSKEYLRSLFGEWNVETIGREAGYHVLRAEKEA